MLDGGLGVVGEKRTPVEAYASQTFSLWIHTFETYEVSFMVSSPSPKPALSNATSEFGKRVRDRRHALKLSQESLAEGTALHWSYLGQVERGHANLTLHNILKIADVLGVDPGELVAGLRPPPVE